MRSGSSSRSSEFGPALDDELGDEVEVGARVDVVRDAGGDDGEDRGGALAADVEPGEEPVLATEDEPAQLALAAIVRQLDVAVFEEQHEPLPLPVQVAERAGRAASSGGMSARCSSSQDAELVDDRLAVLDATRQSLLGGVAGELGRALDRRTAARSSAAPSSAMVSPARAASTKRRRRGPCSPGVCRRRARGSW